ncbi:cyclic nucleotide-binding domain-containing protein (plasmid) [Rhizobium leguminosarum]|uniref:helix-turn-helix domain-containing protein n=1 Tax=Rhizobium leguminosarum TaxID=384 RepID=UPI000DE4BC76|nr:helix-turn-helix domain-containing protein [Rhizobium leguminosarum]MBY5464878.1 helix-turn-helix domain-containing protein [Rhizobium leguminosarum]MBY5901646.1 helix-turn-helix domain-containing protein [Rhizobium leguminosarum]MBY5908290.1 helix-turn-helix domain-containing protein [Rhizobium leguminosarum]TAU16040.1 cyclic nucleotide-binding domain-containing protein [Rhizobium leguminosarum]TAU35975.1 cyclic nucleotide-binding domain-containing protein [Rhizobium leguminosarum]
MLQNHAINYTTARGHRYGGAAATTKDQSIRLKADETIYSEGEHALTIYHVEAGAVRIYRLTAAGQRYILSFYGKGEWFGLETGDIRTDFAEAVCETCVTPFRANHDAVVPIDLLHIALTNLAKAQHKQLVITEQSALKRVAAFVCEMADGHPGDCEFDMMISRSDIADYLGLTVETVARCFTKLREKRILCLNGKLQRIVRLLDRDALISLTI